MPDTRDVARRGPSRRRLMFDMALAAGVAGVLGANLAAGRAAAAPAKLAPGDIGYQTTPKGGQRCELCVNWQPPSSCKTVAGPISPSGWCGLFVRKR
ncbi:MAG: high potential iron sulfur protein [Pseudomonadota bacterium]|nr:high potential iron sulfur protein [Pseudomonadota bacterium]